MLELAFKNTVVTSCLLLLTKLSAVFSDLLTSCTVLSGCCASVVKCAFAVGATLALKIELAAFTTAKLTVSACISCHL